MGSPNGAARMNRRVKEKQEDEQTLHEWVLSCVSGGPQEHARSARLVCPSDPEQTPSELLTQNHDAFKVFRSSQLQMVDNNPSAPPDGRVGD